MPGGSSDAALIREDRHTCVVMRVNRAAQKRIELADGLRGSRKGLPVARDAVNSPRMRVTPPLLPRIAAPACYSDRLFRAARGIPLSGGAGSVPRLVARRSEAFTESRSGRFAA
jgi:hypothetical protein